MWIMGWFSHPHPNQGVCTPRLPKSAEEIIWVWMSSRKIRSAIFAFKDGLTLSLSGNFPGTWFRERFWSRGERRRTTSSSQQQYIQAIYIYIDFSIFPNNRNSFIVVHVSWIYFFRGALSVVVGISRMVVLLETLETQRSEIKKYRGEIGKWRGKQQRTSRKFSKFHTQSIVDFQNTLTHHRGPCINGYIFWGAWVL